MEAKAVGYAPAPTNRTGSSRTLPTPTSSSRSDRWRENTGSWSPSARTSVGHLPSRAFIRCAAEHGVQHGQEVGTRAGPWRAEMPCGRPRDRLHGRSAAP